MPIDDRTAVEHELQRQLDRFHALVGRDPTHGQTGTGEPILGAVSTSSLVALLQRLPASFVELGCHPAASRDVSSSYCDERVAELAALCDPQVRHAVENEGIELRSFADCSRLRTGDVTVT